MKKTILTLALSLASVACVQASTVINKYYVLDSSGNYPVITEVSKKQACDHKAAEQTKKSDYKPPVLSLIKDECSNATIHPNAVTLIQGKNLQESKLVSE